MKKIYFFLLFFNINFHITYCAKILFTTTYFPAFAGRFILNQITGCIESGKHDVYIYAKKRGPEWAHSNIEKYNLMMRVYFGRIPPNLADFDIVFCQFGYRGEDWAKILKKIPEQSRPKLVTCFRGADITQHIQQNPLRYDELFQIGTLFLPVCEYFKTKLIELGCDPQKIIVHHSAIDCDSFFYQSPLEKKHKTFMLVSVSRLVEKKGLEDAIRAVHKAHKKYKNIEYTIVGFGVLEEKLKKLVKKLNAQNYVHFAGRCSEEEIIALHHSSDAFILPSITAKNGNQEGIPNALKEAMACGLPVIATKHAGNKELVIKGSGFLVEEKNINALAEKIKYLYMHPKKSEKMGLVGHDYVVKHFEMHATNQKLIGLFDTLTLPHSKSRGAHSNYFTF